MGGNLDLFKLFSCWGDSVVWGSLIKESAFSFVEGVVDSVGCDVVVPFFSLQIFIVREE